MKFTPPRVLWIIVTLLLASLALFSTTSLLAAPSIPITLPDAGCPMAHCDLQLSDQVHLAVPVTTTTQTVGIVHSDILPIGSRTGLGCASNGTDTAACTFGRFYKEDYPNYCPLSITDTLAIYRIDAAGNIATWRSGELLRCTALYSTPVVAEDGTVIAADHERIIRVTPGNATVSVTLPTKAIPISPVLLETETITQRLFIATKHVPTDTSNPAPIYLYDIATLDWLATLNLEVEGDRFETRNTPGGYGNRIYVLASGIVTQTEGRLFAIDVFTDSMQVAWGNEEYGQSATSFIATPLTMTTMFSFTGPSGASPLVIPPAPPTYPNPIILFDGKLELGGKPHIIAVEDLTTTARLLWTREMTGAMGASFALDPRYEGSGKETMWTFTNNFNDPTSSYADHKYLYRFGISNGQPIGSAPIDVDALVREAGEWGTYVPASAISMAGTESDPALVVSVVKYFYYQGTHIPIRTYIIAIDLETRKLLWKVQTPYSTGQYPIVLDENNGELVFVTTYGKGMRIIGNISIE